MWAVLDVENSRPCKGCEVTTMKKFPGPHGLCFFCLLCWQVSAHAACPYTMSLTPAQFDMGTTSTGTFQITNSGSPSNIIALRFRINNGDHFSGTTTAPAGWTVAFSSASGGGYNTITYSATAGGITPSGSVGFPIAIILHSLSADAAEHLRDVRATYSAGCGGSANATISNLPAWTLKSLVATWTLSSSSIGPGCTFTLTMNIANNSTANLTNVTSANKPPILNVVSGSPTASTSANPTPNSVNLNAGVNGNLVWTYTAGTNPGTMTFTASATASGGRTSQSVASGQISIIAGVTCGFNATFQANSPACAFSGDTVTFKMDVTNNISPAASLSNVVPSVPVKTGTASIGTLSSPSPASIATLTGGGGTGTFTRTAPVTGNADSTFTITAHATDGNGSGSNSTNDAPSRPNPQILKGYPVVVTPTSTVTASSTNVELIWNVTYHGCNPVTKVSIPIPTNPTNWTWTADSYSLVNGVEDWTAAQVGSAVVFSAGTQMPTGSSGEFRLKFSTPVTTSGTVSYNLTVTDSTSLAKSSDSYSLAVRAIDNSPTGSNNTSPGTWREIFQ